jgi:hypothetical protein
MCADTPPLFCRPSPLPVVARALPVSGRGRAVCLPIVLVCVVNDTDSQYSWTELPRRGIAREKAQELAGVESVTHVTKNSWAEMLDSYGAGC